MHNLTFFAKKRFFHRDDQHLMRGSSIIRGEQISKYLGANLNPIADYESDICIYVKPNTQALDIGDIKLVTNSYIDIVDGNNLLLFLKKHSEIPVIVCSEHDQTYLSKELVNKIILIPQQNCNFERVKRDRNVVTTVGMIGARIGNRHIPEKLEAKLREIGLDLIVCGDFKKREDVINFYKKIDIQIIWRPWKRGLSNPLKIVNAASFGIPTVALDEEALHEMEGCYISSATLDSLIENIQLLKSSPALYKKYADFGLEKAEKYHISRVAEMYKKLCI